MSGPGAGGDPAGPPVGTLTTDLGLAGGPRAAVLKGAVLKAARGAQVVDLTHAVLPDWPAEASFWVGACFREFPRGSAHLVTVDPGRGTQRDLVAAEHEGHFFVSYDNGVLEPVVGARPKAAFRIDTSLASRLRQFGLDVGSHWQAKDILAPVAGLLASGRARAADLGSRVEELCPAVYEHPSVTRTGSVRGMVVAVDEAFGNLITNIPQKMLQALHAPVVEAGGLKFCLRAAYGEALPGQNLALVNDLGFLELARAEQNLAASSHLSRGAPVQASESHVVDLRSSPSLVVTDVQQGLRKVGWKQSPTKSPVRAGAGGGLPPQLTSQVMLPKGSLGEAPSVLPRVPTGDLGEMLEEAARGRQAKGAAYGLGR